MFTVQESTPEQDDKLGDSASSRSVKLGRITGLKSEWAKFKEAVTIAVKKVGLLGYRKEIERV